MRPSKSTAGVWLAALSLALGGCSSDEGSPGDAGGAPDAAPDAGDGGTPPDTTGSDLAADGPEVDAAAGPDLSGIVATEGTQAAMDYTLAGGFYAAPWPSDARRLADGRPDLSGFPNPDNVDFLTQTLAVLERDADGFAVSAMVSFAMSGALDPASLPSPMASVEDASPVVLLSVDPDAPDHLKRYPLSSAFLPDPGPYGVPDMLALLPYQGIPLRDGTTYAAVVRRSLGDVSGAPLGVPQTLAEIAAGGTPAGMSDADAGQHRAALAAVAEAGIPLDDVAALSVFTTGTPRAGMRVLREDVLSRPLPEPKAPFALSEVYDDFCVYETLLDFPSYQAGEPPFLDGGGGWRYEADGTPIVQRQEEGRLFATIPRSAMPEAGYPIVVYVRAGGGGDRPLVDRGVRQEPGGDTVPGSGPAIHISRAGFAGLQGDGPHGGIRNFSGLEENVLLYPVTNPEALRDNLRQSALDVVMLANMLDALSVDASECPGATAEARFDADLAVLMGHSNGGWISPMALAVEPIYKAGILSGAGGSWTENLVYKKSPLDVPTIAKLLLNYGDRELHRHDPAVNLLQWAGEPADPALYGQAIIDEPPAGGPPKHILMFQGIVDTYILPSIAHASSLAQRLDLAGEPREEESPELEGFFYLPEVLPLVDRRHIALPAQANREVAGGADPVTAVVVQYLEDPIEDGHEVMYQLDGPKHQYRCFLQSLAAGGDPVVVEGGAELAPCP